MQIKAANFYSNTNVRVLLQYNLRSICKIRIKNVGIVNTFTFLSVRINKNESWSSKKVGSCGLLFGSVSDHYNRPRSYGFSLSKGKYEILRSEGSLHDVLPEHKLQLKYLSCLQYLTGVLKAARLLETLSWHK